MASSELTKSVDGRYRLSTSIQHRLTLEERAPPPFVVERARVVALLAELYVRRRFVNGTEREMWTDFIYDESLRLRSIHPAVLAIVR